MIRPSKGSHKGKGAQSVSILRKDQARGGAHTKFMYIKYFRFSKY